LTGNIIGFIEAPVPDFPIYNAIAHDFDVVNRKIVYLWNFVNDTAQIIILSYDHIGNFIDVFQCSVPDQLFGNVTDEVQTSSSVAYVGSELYITYGVSGQPGYLVKVVPSEDNTCIFTKAPNPLPYAVFTEYGSRFVGLNTTQSVYFFDSNFTAKRFLSADVVTGLTTEIPLSFPPVNEFFFLFSAEDSSGAHVYLGRGDNRLYEIDVFNYTQTKIISAPVQALTKVSPLFMFDPDNGVMYGPDFEISGTGKAVNVTGICGADYVSYSNRPFDYQVGLAFPVPTVAMTSTSAEVQTTMEAMNQTSEVVSTSLVSSLTTQTTSPAAVLSLSILAMILLTMK